MLTITRVGVNRLEMTMTGKLHSDDMRQVLDEFVEKSGGIEAGTMLCDVVDYQMPTLGAMAVEFSQMPRLMRVTAQFRKMAVLADKAWIRNVSEFEGHLIPGLEIRGFERDARQQAEDWLASGE